MSTDLNPSTFTNLMHAIANSNVSRELISDSFTETNQARMFLVAQAKNEMQRIVRLSTFLDTVEAKFADTATTLMNEYPDNLDIVQNTLDTLMKCINRSNELIMAIMKDEKLNSFVFQSDDTDIAVEYKDITAESRENVRAFAQNMLNRFSKISAESLSSSDESESIAVDSDSNNEEDTLNETDS